jgi:hypothetical protein
MGGRRQRIIDRVAGAIGAAAGGAIGATLGWALGGNVAALAGAGAGLAAGLAAIRFAGGPVAGYALDLVALAERTDPAADELLLDDPLIPATPELRAVRLFRNGAEVALPQPGELAGRIDRWLGQRRETGEDGAARDSRGELHAALADIRASLR